MNPYLVIIPALTTYSAHQRSLLCRHRQSRPKGTPGELSGERVVREHILTWVLISMRFLQEPFWTRYAAYLNGKDLSLEHTRIAIYLSHRNFTFFEEMAVLVSINRALPTKPVIYFSRISKESTASTGTELNSTSTEIYFEGRTHTEGLAQHPLVRTAAPWPTLPGTSQDRMSHLDNCRPS